jgi:hypothetical protein
VIAVTLCVAIAALHDRTQEQSSALADFVGANDSNETLW